MGDGSALTFDVYGLRFEVGGDRPDVLDAVGLDFSWFGTDEPPGDGQPIVRILVHGDPSAAPRPPRMRATLLTPRNVVFRNGRVSYLDYAGRALVEHIETEHRFDVYGGSDDLAHEIVFLTMLSRIGSHLDARGYHRVHALGLEARGRAVVVLLPMGGGKTSLAMRLLRADGVRLLSEDSPLLGPDGRVHPFPLRIGVRPGGVPDGIPPEACRTVERMEFGPKTLIDVTHFGDRLAGACPPGVLLLGERWSAGASFVAPASRGKALRALVRDCVVGVGLFQGIEFVLRSSGWEVLGRFGLALRRLRAAARLVRCARIHRFGMGPDVDEAAETLRRFLVDGHHSTEATT